MFLRSTTFASFFASTSRMRLVPAAFAFVALLIVVSVSLPAAHGSFQFKSPRVTSGLVSLYTFEEGAATPSSLQSSDQSGVNALGNISISPSATSAMWTAGRAGLHLNGTGNTSRAVSAFNVTSLISMIAAKSQITIELWYASSSTTESGMIFGFGSWATKAHELGVCSTAYDLAVFQVNSMLSYLMLANGSSSPLTCVQNSQPVVAALFNHHTIVITSTGASSYVNAVLPAASTSVVQLNFTSWNKSTSLMFGQPVYNIGGGSYTNTTWAGDIFLFAIYNRALNQSEVQQNYAAGVPFSIPVATPSNAWVAVQAGVYVANLAALPIALPTLNYSNYDATKYSSVSMQITLPPSVGYLYTYPGNVRIGGNVSRIPFRFAVNQVFGYQAPAQYSGVDTFLFAANSTAGSSSNSTVYVLVIVPPWTASSTIAMNALANGKTKHTTQ